MFLLASTHVREPVPAGVVPHSLFFFMLFGAPVAYLVAGAIGLPVVLWLEGRGSLRLLPLLFLSSGTGAMALGLGWSAFWDVRRPELLSVGIGAVAGAIAALVFWAIAVRQTVSRPAA